MQLWRFPAVCRPTGKFHDMIFIVVKFRVRPEWTDRWLSLVADFTSATRAEPGNLFFEWSRSVDRDDEFVLLEAFRDGDAGAEHVNSAHFKAAMESMPQAILETPQIVNVEVPQEGWGPMAELQPRAAG
jgi:quinol monooxygenase YgiN